jgi:hypothetical protein
MIVTLHGGMSVYAIQLLLSFLGIGFSMLMISSNHDVGSYYPVVTSILGYWLPSPILLSMKSDSSKLASNPFVLLFGTQVALSFLTLSFSGLMLYNDGDSAVFLPVITGIVGIWLPHPTLEEMRDGSSIIDGDFGGMDAHLLNP